jgi:hypothetical protein
MNRIHFQAGLALALAACTLALPSAAGAEETKVLFKCVDVKGTVSIQAKKCPAGSTEVWQRPAQTEPKPTEAQEEAARQRELQNQQQVRDLTVEVQKKLAGDPPVPANPPAGSQLAPTRELPPPDPQVVQAAATSQCQAAQTFVASVREKSWIGMTDEQMARIMNWVLDQCRVNPNPAQ